MCLRLDQLHTVGTSFVGFDFVCVGGVFVEVFDFLFVLGVLFWFGLVK